MEEKQILAIGKYHHGITTLHTKEGISKIMTTQHKARQIMKDAIKQNPAVGNHLHETIKIKKRMDKMNNQNKEVPLWLAILIVSAVIFVIIFLGSDILKMVYGG